MRSSHEFNGQSELKEKVESLYPDFNLVRGLNKVFSLLYPAPPVD